MGRCYICGHEESRRIVTDRLMLLVCRERECGQVAAQLPASHCSARLPGGHVCGAPASPQFEVDGARMCALHQQAHFRSSDVRQ